MRASSLCVVFCLAASWLAAARSQAEDWPHWRGPNRNGIVAEASGFSGDAWPLKELWRANVGEGSSSPLVIGERLYTMGWRDGRDHVVCLSAASGKPLWSVSYACPRFGRVATGDQGIYSGPSSTPEYDPRTTMLYTLSLDGDLNCWDAGRRGEKLWGKNLYETYDVPQRPKVGRSGRRDYGYTSSPLIHGNWLIVEVGAKSGNLMAFDKGTGRRVWASQSKSPAGHNGGPVPMTVEGVPCVAVQNHDGLLVVRIDNGHEGETVATHAWETSFANNIATAAVHGNSVLITSSYNHHKMARIDVTLRGGKKAWEVEHASGVCTPVIKDGRVYWAWRQVMCLDFETGRLRWQGGRVGDQGSLIVSADDRLIVWTNEGDLSLAESAKRSPDRYTELSLRKGGGRSDAWPHVVLADGRLFCKTRDGEVRAFAVGSR